jgi:hypothetical protein
MDTIRDFARGETIYITYTDISYAGKEPLDATGLTFFFTVVDLADRSEVVRLYTGSGITVDELGTEIEVEVRLDTDIAGFEAYGAYEADFWVLDSAMGKHRLDTFRLRMDEPETTNFVV